MTRPRTRDVAIVGNGPKGFGCLERLVLETRRCADPPQLRVSLHDPRPHPGAGPVYDPSQPPHLLMNYAARHVDVWSRDGQAPDDASRPDLVAWLAGHDPRWADGDAFVPRRLVGAYLQAAFWCLLEDLPPQLDVERVAGTVTDVQPSGSGWWVRHDDAALDRHVDEVVVTVGHGTWTPRGDRPRRSPERGTPAEGRRRGGTRTVAPAYPVADQLGQRQVPAGATVAVRGFALGFVDVALSLTVGRRGRFEGLDGDDPTTARYHRSGAEVGRIVPFSRTGLPLLAKPGPELVARAAELPEVWEQLRRRVLATGGQPLRPGLVAALSEAAVAALEHVHGSLPGTAAQAAGLLAAGRAPYVDGTGRARTDVPDDGDAGRGDAGHATPDAGHAGRGDAGHGGRSLAAMRRSVEVALGRQSPDAAWAVGEAWRQCYPALVERLGHGGVDAEERPELDALARRMERLAFGPPAANLQRIVVLADAGLVDLRHLRTRLDLDAGGLWLVSGERLTTVDVLVDAVVDPPGVTPSSPLWGPLLHRGHVRVAAGTRAVEVTADASCVGPDGAPVPGLAAVGRATEGWVLGNDTLSRTLHDETRLWARRVVAVDGPEATPPPDATSLPDATSPPDVTSPPDATRELRRHCHGTPPVDARLEAWQVALCADPARLDALVTTHGSPLNVHDTVPFDRNVARLQRVAADRGVPLEVLFARKADKALAYVERARELGIGVDTASEEELAQVLAAGVDPALVVTTAAVKTEALLRAAIASGTTIVLDNDDELERVLRLAGEAGTTAPVALRLGGFEVDGQALATRFGFEVAAGTGLGARLATPAGRAVRVEGLHFHLDGYDVAHRVAGVAQLLPLVDRLREQGHPVRHLDVGGGLPMSYVDDRGQWTAFRTALREALLGERPPITHANDGLGLHAHDGQVHGRLATYPCHQDPTAADWLAALLDAPLGAGRWGVAGDDALLTARAGDAGSVADALRARGLTLRCEPGRSLLDGCGLTVARVEHRKQHADGSWSIGVAMNHTQCATSKADHAVDPLLVPTGPVRADGPAVERGGPVEGFLTGAYCTESDLLTRRRLRFPSGVERGDLVVFPNTAGYLMHFVESRSHRFPLARNVVLDPRDGTFALDAVDVAEVPTRV